MCSTSTPGGCSCVRFWTSGAGLGGGRCRPPSRRRPGRHAWEDGGPEDRLVLSTVLLRLPKRRRAALVLRFWADLSVEQVAEILDCPIGTVKSLTARGLADLRAQLGDALLEFGRPGSGRGVMREVRDIAARMLAGPEPPLRPSRRGARHRPAGFAAAPGLAGQRRRGWSGAGHRPGRGRAGAPADPAGARGRSRWRRRRLPVARAAASPRSADGGGPARGGAGRVHQRPARHLQ